VRTQSRHIRAIETIEPELRLLLPIRRVIREVEGGHRATANG
jgi:hypothetical protein